MFKTKEEIIVIQAEATTPISTGVVFWSHDKGTAKMLFQLQKDYVNQTLAKGTIVPICLVFIGGRHIYHAVIEDAVNGIVSIVLEDNILGYVGRVDGSIYIELPDSRSLDTAGRFTFDIKRSPIDENVPELEDYYWQGFNEIMTQYHETIATIKLEAKVLLDSLTADVTKVKNDIATANTHIEEINQKIDDNDVFTKQESSANVVYQIIGKDEVEVTLTLNLKNKIVGSFDENKNMAKGGGGNTLFLPTAPFSEFDNAAYRLIETLDSKAKFSTVGSVNGIAQIVLYYDVLGYVKDELGEAFFRDRGATTIAEQSSLIRTELITNYKARHFGYGLANAKNKLSMACRVFDSNSWVNTVSHTNSSISGLVIDTNYITNKIDNDGFANIIVFAEATDGTSSSQVITDYTSLEIKLKISANDHIKSLIAANHVQNLATQDEAEAGTDNTKSMTPLRTAQQIDKRAVTIAGNQTVGGIKNFNDGLMAGNISVLTAKAATQTFDSSTTPEIQAGSIKFTRYGPYVIGYLNFQVRADSDITQDQNVFYGLNSDLACDADFFDFVSSYAGATALINVTANKIAARTTLVKSTWYVGRIFYKAKN